MSLSISSSIPIITPVYAPLEVTIANSGCDYLELDIYVGDSSKGQYEGTKRTLRIINDSAVADIQNIVQPFFESDASGVVELKRIDIRGRSWLNDVSTQLYLDNYYVFNGVAHETFDPSTYVMDENGNAQFLNRWDAPINIHWGDNDTKMYFFQGTFTNSTGSYAANAPSFRIKKDGVLSAGYQFSSDTTPRIKEFNISPSSLNSLIPGLSITSATKTYTVDPSQNTGNFGIKTVNIYSKDERYIPKRIAWVDSFGCIDYFNFDLAQTNTVNVTRNIFNNNGVFKSFNNKVVDSYSITSNWISEDESEALKDLWYSPSTMIDGKYVILSNKTVQVLKRRDVKLINYAVDYEMSNEYKVQIF